MYKSFGRHQTFCKNEKELETQIQTVRIYNQDIGMGFGIERCTMLVMKNGVTTHNRKRRTTKSSSHQNAQRKGNLQILGDIGS